jgi:hypothetical protein
MRALRISPFVLALSSTSLSLLGALGGCSSDGQFIVVTVDARPAVHDVARLSVTLSNAGSMRTESLPVSGAGFPATFSISPEERTGDLALSIEAYNAADELIGRGTVQSTIEASTAAVRLDPTDFVVNTDPRGAQQLSNYYLANGLQLAATQSGTWTAVYNDDCTTTECNILGRRFDPAARAVSSVVAAGTQGFPVTTQLTTSFSTPAVAANANTTVAVWNHRDGGPPIAYSIQCRALDERGAAAANQQLISTDEFPYMVATTALPTGNFAVVWPGRQTNTFIRAAIVSPMCTLVGTIQAISPNVASVFPNGAHLAANATNILYAWKLDGSVRARLARHDGTPLGTADFPVATKTATEQVEHVRVAPLGAGFAVLVRWALITGSTGPGRIELYRVSNTGTVMGAPTLVTDRSGTDFASSEGFGVAPRSDGTMLVVWHACMDKGDGSGCGVFGRMLTASGDPAGADFSLATTTTGDQTRPAAVALPDGAFAAAWSDKSGAAPDPSETAVRARIIYPGAGQ